MKWCKFPTAWVGIGQVDDPDSPALRPLRALMWQDYRVTAAAALIVLLAIAIRHNELKGGRELENDPRPSEVPVTYDELEELTGFPRPTVAKALKLLQELRLIVATKVGRSMWYGLPGLHGKGGWCQVPQEHLLRGASGGLRRLRGTVVNRVVLNALKLYILLLANRNQRANTSAMSYRSMEKYSGVRRSDISPALSHLTALQLVTVAEDQADDRTEDRSMRYELKGLKPISRA